MFFTASLHYSCNHSGIPFVTYFAGICAKGGYEYAVSVYHYVMTLAHAAQAETLQYHGNDATAGTAFEKATWHLQELEVITKDRCRDRNS